MGRHLQCLWHDVGYAGQDYSKDYSEWMPSDFCLQFEGLVEDYRKVCDTTLPRQLTMIGSSCNLQKFQSAIAPRAGSAALVVI